MSDHNNHDVGIEQAIKFNSHVIKKLQDRLREVDKAYVDGAYPSYIAYRCAADEVYNCLKLHAFIGDGV